MSASPFIAHLSLESSVGAELTQTRIRLLEAIAATGSISQAAKRVPLSYKAAWDAVDQINNLSAQPLVARSTGGSGGGGTRLTAYGQRVVAFYRALEQHYQSTLDQAAARLDEVSRTAGGLPDTCSPVGTGGQTGCSMMWNRNWAAERRAIQQQEQAGR